MSGFDETMQSTGSAENDFHRENVEEAVSQNAEHPAQEMTLVEEAIVVEEAASQYVEPLAQEMTLVEEAIVVEEASSQYVEPPAQEALVMEEAASQNAEPPMEVQCSTPDGKPDEVS